jgi:hypothetical protein
MTTPARFPLPVSLLVAFAVGLIGAHAQVNSGSNGSDGAFNPTTNTVINMADHPTGIYHYTSVNISNGVTVTFIPNANNTPVVWLVQSNCAIDGGISLSGRDGTGGQGGLGGPGGAAGVAATAGQGLGGGNMGSVGANAFYGTLGGTNGGMLPGATYGNTYLIPLLGGSGGGGSTNLNYIQESDPARVRMD